MERLNEYLDLLFESIAGVNIDVFSYATMLIRFVLPVLALIIVTRSIRMLLQRRNNSEIWGYLSLPNGSRIELKHWENVIGRAKTSDVFMQYPTLSRSHAVVMRDAKGNWKIYDAESRKGIIINDKKVEGDKGTSIVNGDVIDLGGVRMVFILDDDHIIRADMISEVQSYMNFNPVTTLFYLTLFQLLLGLQLCISKGEQLMLVLPVTFLGLITLMWLSYAVSRRLRKANFEIEILAFFLTTIGFSVVATGSQTDLMRQLFLVTLGVIMFFAISWFLRDLDRVQKLRIPIAAAGLALLAVNVAGGLLGFVESVHGATRWMVIGGVSFQPSEIVKIAFIFAGAATMDHLLKKRNLYFFIGFAAMCVMGLTLITDFGSALIFFVAYLVIAFLRSGEYSTLLLSIGGAGFAGIMALQFWSHIARRFATWGNAWEHIHTGGFQQTHAMAAVASGGLFGVGAGNGWFKNIFAGDSDLVFALVSEELGLLIAIMAISCILTFVIYSVITAGESRSSFYVIGACAAASILIFQMILNVFGSMDILPFTGVTFPFVSKGGTSLISCWGLLAFIKAADTHSQDRGKKRL